jgi:hypothetical protein
MRLVRMRELAAKLGIPIRTFQSWVEADPSLSVLRKGPGKTGKVHWIKLDHFAGRHGIDLTDAYMLGSSKWLKAVTLAELSGISRRTIAHWCRDRPKFAKRIGRIYYIDLEQLGAGPEDIQEIIRRMGQESGQEIE